MSSKDANSEVEDNKGFTLLHEAAMANDSQMAKDLIGSGAIDINAIDHRGQTALHVAFEQGSIEVAELLLESEADTTGVDSFGLTPLDYKERLGKIYYPENDKPHKE